MKTVIFGMVPVPVPVDTKSRWRFLFNDFETNIYISTSISKIHLFYMYRTKIILVKNIFLEYCHFTCMYVCTHVPIQSRKKKKGCFYQTMSINIPRFFLINCECVSKHYKSSKLSSIYKMNHRNKQRKENELAHATEGMCQF